MSDKPDPKVVAMSGVFCVVLICLFGWWVISDLKSTFDDAAREDAVSEEGSNNTPSIGDRAVLRWPDDTHRDVLVGIDKEALTAAGKAGDAGDGVGQWELLASGRVMFIEPGTEVLVIDRSWFTDRVRILSGRYANRAVWVACEAVQSPP